MRLLVLIFLMVASLGPALLLALDPFHTEEQMKKMVEAYKMRKPPPALVAKRETHGVPICLLVEIVRVPSFTVSSVSLTEAIKKLRDEMLRLEPRFTQITWTFDLDSVTLGNRITLDLKNTSVLQLIRFITELGGASFVFDGKRVTIAVDHSFRNTWSAPRIANLPISDGLAGLWFPDVKDRLPSAPLIMADPKLDSLGIPFWEGVRADYVPSMNVISVVHSDVGIRCLRSLIIETENELRIRDAIQLPESIPKGMSLRSLDAAPFAGGKLKNTLKIKDGLIDPDSVTTQDALMFLGAIFPAESAAWFERSKKRLHLLNRPEVIEEVLRLLEND